MFKRSLNDEITAGDLLALVNYLPYGTKTDRNIGYSEEHTAIQSDDLFSLDILNIKQMAKNGLPKWKKDKIDFSVALFVHMFCKIIELSETGNIELSVIPSSTKDNHEHGMSKFCEILSQKTNIHFNRNTLMRTETIGKAATTGERDEDRNFETLETSGNVAGKIVLLVDDVTTSGSSRNAAQQKLEEAGASMVFFLAIGQTLSHYRFSTESAPCTLIAKHWDLFFGLILHPLKASSTKDAIISSANNNKALLFYKKASESSVIATNAAVEALDNEDENPKKTGKSHK